MRYLLTVFTTRSLNQVAIIQELSKDNYGKSSVDTNFTSQVLRQMWPTTDP